MIHFPNVSPEIFSFSVYGFEFALRWYALSYLIGFVLALFIMKKYLNKPSVWSGDQPPMRADDADSLLTFLIIGVIVGGRFGYVFFYNLDYYLESPVDILKVWDGGMAFHGGFLGVVLAAVFYCRLNTVPLLAGADLIALSTPPGLFLGRLANFINGELWGKPTDLPWGVVFPGERAQFCEDVVGFCARHPSQLYEAFLQGLLLFIVLMILANRGLLKLSGTITGIFLVCYGVARFTVEFFRVPDPQFFSVDNPYGFAYSFYGFGVTMGQALSLPMVLAGIIFIWIAFLKSYSTER